MSSLPILYSFRRCPYAMRARLALAASEIPYEHREVVLRDKPPAMLIASPKGTVPVLVLPSEEVLDESEDIMLWALGEHDPQSWLAPSAGTLAQMRELVRRTQDEFKCHLDRYKYENRYEGVSSLEQRGLASTFLKELDQRLGDSEFLFGAHFSFADAAVAPFVRQFAHTDRAWFDEQAWAHLREWLERFLASERFVGIMGKHEPWVAPEVAS